MAMGELTCSTPIYVVEVKGHHFVTTGSMEYSGRVRPYDSGIYAGWVNWKLDIETNEEVKMQIEQYSSPEPNYVESSLMCLIPASDNSRIISGTLEYSYAWSRNDQSTSGGGWINKTGRFYDYAGNFGSSIWFNLQVSAGASIPNWGQVPSLRDLFLVPNDGSAIDYPACIGSNGSAMDKYSQDTTYKITCSSGLVEAE